MSGIKRAAEIHVLTCDIAHAMSGQKLSASHHHTASYFARGSEIIVRQRDCHTGTPTRVVVRINYAGHVMAPILPTGHYASAIEKQACSLAQEIRSSIEFSDV